MCSPGPASTLPDRRRHRARPLPISHGAGLADRTRRVSSVKRACGRAARATMFWKAGHRLRPRCRGGSSQMWMTWVKGSSSCGVECADAGREDSNLSPVSAPVWSGPDVYHALDGCHGALVTGRPPHAARRGAPRACSEINYTCPRPWDEPPVRSESEGQGARHECSPRG